MKGNPVGNPLELPDEVQLFGGTVSGDIDVVYILTKQS